MSENVATVETLENVATVESTPAQDAPPAPEAPPVNGSANGNGKPARKRPRKDAPPVSVATESAAEFFKAHADTMEHAQEGAILAYQRGELTTFVQWALCGLLCIRFVRAAVSAKRFKRADAGSIIGAKILESVGYKPDTDTLQRSAAALCLLTGSEDGALAFLDSIREGKTRPLAWSAMRDVFMKCVDRTGEEGTEWGWKDGMDSDGIRALWETYVATKGMSVGALLDEFNRVTGKSKPASAPASNPPAKESEENASEESNSEETTPAGGSANASEGTPAQGSADNASEESAPEETAEDENADGNAPSLPSPRRVKFAPQELLTAMSAAEDSAALAYEFAPLFAAEHDLFKAFLAGIMDGFRNNDGACKWAVNELETALTAAPTVGTVERNGRKSA